MIGNLSDNKIVYLYLVVIKSIYLSVLRVNNGLARISTLEHKTLNALLTNINAAK